MNIKEQIKAEIERLIEINKTKNGFPAGTICAARIEAYKVLLERIDSLPEEQPSEDLEQEVKRFLESEESTTYENAGSYKVAVKDPVKIARHFAQWQKEQMLKGAVDTTMVEGSLNNPTFVRRKIIIVKEDKK